MSSYGREVIISVVLGLNLLSPKSQQSVFWTVVRAQK
jgi:hypothetical protein